MQAFCITYRLFLLFLQSRRITGNAEVRPANVSAAPSAVGGESDVKYLPTFLFLMVQELSDFFTWHNADCF